MGDNRLPSGRADQCNGLYPKALRGILVTENGVVATRTELITKSFLQGLLNASSGPTGWYGVVNSHDDTSPGPVEYTTPTGSGIARQNPRQFTAYLKSNIWDFQDIYQQFQNFCGKVYLIFDGKILEGTETEVDSIYGYSCTIEAVKKMPTQEDNQQFFEVRVYLQDVEEEIDTYYGACSFPINTALKSAMPVGYAMKLVSNGGGTCEVILTKRSAKNGVPEPVVGADSSEFLLSGTAVTTAVDNGGGAYTLSYTTAQGDIQYKVVDTVVTKISNKITVLQ